MADNWEQRAGKSRSNSALSIRRALKAREEVRSPFLLIVCLRCLPLRIVAKSRAVA
jgi:hypothetical protein